MKSLARDTDTTTPPESRTDERIHPLASPSCGWSWWDGTGEPPRAPFCCQRHVTEAATGLDHTPVEPATPPSTIDSPAANLQHVAEPRPHTIDPDAFCTRVDRLLIVHECPFCHETHSHGGEAHSDRRSHCAEPGSSYFLVPVASEEEARLRQADRQGFLVVRSRRADDATREAWNRRGFPNVVVTRKTANAIARWDFGALPSDRHPTTDVVRGFVDRVVTLGCDRRTIAASPRFTSIIAPWQLALRVAEEMLRVVGRSQARGTECVK
jgi:hypothetical protein